MVDTTPALDDADAIRDHERLTAAAVYRVFGTVGAGASFSLQLRGAERPGFSHSGTELTLPEAGNYRIQIAGHVRNAGTANPQSVVVDLYDDETEDSIYTVARNSADPTVPALFGEPATLADGNPIEAQRLRIEEDIALTGPISLRNGSANEQTSDLVLRIWQLPETYTRPSPLSLYVLAGGRVGAGEAYFLRQVGPKIYGFDIDGRSLGLPGTGSWNVEVTGTARSYAAGSTNLIIDLYDDETEEHSESLAAAAPSAAEPHPSVTFAISESLTMGGRLSIRNGRADDLQVADLLVKVWQS